MHDPSPKFVQPTLWDTHSATSSLASEDGLSHSGFQDGQQPEVSGQPPVHVNRSVRQGRGKEKKTSGTSGRSSQDLSTPVSLQSLLSNRLRQNLAAYGSLEYSLTWKEWDIAGQEPICAVRASVHRTSGSDFTGWPTANAGPQNDNDSTWERRRQELKDKHINGNGFGLTLGQAATLAGWRSPDAFTRGGPQDAARRAAGGHQVNLQDQASQLAMPSGWQTPKASDGKFHTPRTSGRPVEKSTHLQTQAMVALGSLGQLESPSGWATPTVRDHKDGASVDNVPENSLLVRQCHSVTGNGSMLSPAATEMADASPRGVLNPAFSAWLMGFPLEWLLSGIRGIRSHGKRLKAESRSSRGSGTPSTPTSQQSS